MKTKTEKVKPCPFCGSKKLTIVNYLGYYIKCSRCFAGYGFERCTRVVAIEHWNLRRNATGLVTLTEHLLQ